MSVDEKHAPFEVHEFTSRDAAIAVLRTVSHSLVAAAWALIGFGVVFMLAGVLGGGLPFVTAALVLAGAGSVCGVVYWRISKGVERLAREDR